jgi:hypothetical protein
MTLLRSLAVMNMMLCFAACPTYFTALVVLANNETAKCLPQVTVD